MGVYVCVKEAESLVSAVLPADKCAAAPEIAVYLKESVGNATRIDYGTGNRIMCLWHLCCIFSQSKSQKDKFRYQKNNK